MKKLSCIILLFFAIRLPAQLLYFPPSYYSDSIELDRHMPVLAKQVIFLYKNADRAGYYDNLLSYQLVAEQYSAAVGTLDSLRNLLKAADSNTVKGLGFQFQTFAAAKIEQEQHKLLFSDAYTTAFTRLYNALPGQAAAAAAVYFDNNLQPLRDNLNKILSSQKGKDSIALTAAGMLCRAYNAYNINRQIMPLAIPLLTAIDNQKFIIEDSVLIKTSDGALIAATIVRKRNGAGKQPVVFVFNIYNGARDKAIAKNAAINGYVGIVANTRGKRLSPQQIEPFEHDASDAYDIIDWISKQPWCNGKIGMYGGSYLGFSQWAAAKHVHPVLKTIIPQVAVGIGIDYPMENNVFMSYMLQWIHYVTNSKETDQQDFSNAAHWNTVFNQWYTSGKTFRSLDTIEKRPNSIFQRWLKHPSFDAYWQNMAACKNDFAKINIPVLTTTGYYDDDQLGAMYYFKQHYLYNKNATHYLVIGPYNHGGAQSIPVSILQGYTIDAVANISFINLAYQWFDYVLKDSARPGLIKDKINYQVMGTNEWKHAPSLAAMNNDSIRLYLDNTRTGPHYKLSSKKPLLPEFIRQEIDFKDRSDTANNTAANVLDSVLDRSNGLSFISDPVDKAFEINGSFAGALAVAINKKDIDVFVTLHELLPDGKYFDLGNYLTRASYTKNRSVRQLLQPGKMETIPINNSFFVSKKISAGSRLVVVVGIRKNAAWQINYGTGKDVSDESVEDARIPLQIKWYNSSIIVVPVHR